VKPEMDKMNRHGPAMAIFFAACLIMALIFGAVVLSGGSPVRPEFYGPLVYAVPALVWAGTQALLSAMGLAGCLLMRPRLGAIGAFGISGLFQFFAAAAVVAGATGTLLVAMAVPASAIAMISAIVMWRAANER